MRRRRKFVCGKKHRKSVKNTTESKIFLRILTKNHSTCTPVLYNHSNRPERKKVRKEGKKMKERRKEGRKDAN